LTVAISGAQVERSFSILNIIKSSTRNRQNSITTENLMRVFLNGPSTNKFQPMSYAKAWTNERHFKSDARGQRQEKIETEEWVELGGDCESEVDEVSGSDLYDSEEVALILAKYDQTEINNIPL
jgi:hypothetical protein